MFLITLVCYKGKWQSLFIFRLLPQKALIHVGGEEKIKNEEAQGILKFGNFCEFLRFLETFWLLFVFFY